MIFFDHQRRPSTLPKSLEGDWVSSHNSVIHKRMMLSPEERAQSDVPLVWKSTFYPDVVNALLDLSRERCAFCETRDMDLNIRAYRFRPPANAEPVKTRDGKDCYLWLTFEWSNLFPICGNCRPRNPNFFPVEGKRLEYDPNEVLSRHRERPDYDEAATLYYPGEIDQPHLRFDIGFDGKLIGLNKRAVATIGHFNLNTRRTVEARLNELKIFINHLKTARADLLSAKLRALAFGGVKYLMMRKIGEKLLERYQIKRTADLVPDRIQRLFSDLFQRDDYEKTVASVIEGLELSFFGVEDAVEPMLRTAPSDLPTLESGIAVEAAPVSEPEPVTSFRLASLQIRNFKSLERISCKLDAEPRPIPLPAGVTVESRIIPKVPCLLLLGENATGKSSILEALTIALTPPSEHEAILPKGISRLVLDPEYMGSEAEPGQRVATVRIGFYRLEDGHLPEPDNPQIAEVKMRIDPTNAQSVSIEMDPALRPALPPIFAYGAHRLFGTQRRTGAARHVDTLFRIDRSLSNPEKWLCSLGQSDLDAVVRALRHIIQIDGEFQQIEVVRPTGAEPFCRIHLRKNRPDGKTYLVKQRLDTVSSGYRAVLAVACDVIEGLMKLNGQTADEARQAPAIVVIDEIEAHLHPRWKIRLVEGLRRALDAVTFVMTSHDPLCIRGMLNGEIMVLERLDGASPTELAEGVEALTELRNPELLTVEQLLTSDFFQLVTTDDRIGTEGLASYVDIVRRAETAPTSLTPQEREFLQMMRREVRGALPFGQTEIAREVHDAVARFMDARRNGAGSAGMDAARADIRKEVAGFLKGILG